MNSLSCSTLCLHCRSAPCGSDRKATDKGIVAIYMGSKSGDPMPPAVAERHDWVKSPRLATRAAATSAQGFEQQGQRLAQPERKAGMVAKIFAGNRMHQNAEP